MKKYDFIELVVSSHELENKGIIKGSKGTIIELKNNNARVIFFNDKNLGDYAIADVDINLLKGIGELPKDQIHKLNDVIKNLNFEKNQEFNTPCIKEYDLVELIVESEKYSKHDVHKGDKGCVISQYAIQNKVEVDFTALDEDSNFHGDCIVVNIKDLKILKK